MQHEAMITALKSLKLFGMAHAVDELAKQGAPAYQSAQTLLAMQLPGQIWMQFDTLLCYAILSRFTRRSSSCSLSA